MAEMKATIAAEATLQARLTAGEMILNDYRLIIEDIEGGHRLTATRGSEVQSIDIMDGADGVSPVFAIVPLLIPDPNGGLNKFVDGYDISITDANGTQKIRLESGKTGIPGANGKTPEKGVDYFTEEEIQEIIDKASAGGGAVTSVNGKVGAVELKAEDVGAMRIMYSRRDADSGETIEIMPEPGSGIRVKSIISPAQSGKGRPYAGGKGRNMLPPAAVSEITSNGIKFTPLDDGGIHLKGTCTASAGSGAFFNVPMNITVAAGNYRFSAGNTTACPDLQIRLTNASGTTLLNNAANIAMDIDHTWKPLTVSAETEIAKYMLRFTGGATYDVTIYPMLAEGEATDFEPYENLRPMVGCNSLQLTHDGESYERALADSVYGGEYEWGTAQMTVTYGHIASYNGESLPGEWISDRDVYAEGSTPSSGAEVVYKLETPNVYTVGEVIDLRANDGINHLEANTRLAAEYVESDLSAQDRADKVEAVDNFVFGEKELTGERIVIECNENDTIKILGDGEIKLRHSGKNTISTVGGNGSIYSNNGVTYTRSSNGAITISGTASKGSSFILMKDYIPAGRYILSATRMMKDTVGYVDINTIADDGTETQIARMYNRKETVFVLPEGAQVMVRVYTTITGAAIDETLSLMLEMSDVGTTATEYEPYAGVVNTVALPAELKAHEGINSLYADGEVLIVEIKNNLDDQIDDDAKKSKQDDIEELVGKLGLPILDLAGDISAMSKDNAVELQYSFRDRAGTCTCKWQGSSSQYYPKKNYTLKFDEKFEAVVTDTDAPDEFRKPWGKQKKFVVKANWIDASHLRNIVSAKLWADIVATRSNLPEQLINSPNYGAIAGFPIMIRINGISQGLYTWNIPKDDWMAGMGDGEKESIVCAEVTDSLGTRFMGVDNLKFKDDEGNALAPDFELEYVPNEDDTAWVTESLKTMIQACIDSDGSDIDTKLAQYIDIDSAIDYYIFTVLLRGVDMMSRNYLLMTYDGVKWRFGAYDLDSTYGISGTGNSYITGGEWTTLGGRNPTFAGFAAHHRLMELIYTYKKDALVQRYNQLRGHVLEKDSVYDKFLNFANTIPQGAYDVDRFIWPHIPSSSTSSVNQIMTQYAISCELADKELGLNTNIFVLTSPNGTNYKIMVADDGTLTTIAAE